MSLLDDVSIVVTPNGYKAGTLFAVKPTDVLGSEEITNGDFSNGLTDWTENGGSYATIVSGALNSNNPDAGNWYAENISQNVSFVNGTTYKLTFKAKNISGNLNLRITQNSNVIASLNLTSTFVDYTYFYTANADNGSIRIFCNSAVGQFQIDDISVKEWTGADMDVTRATAATRVDEAGLVNYAEILGSEQVTNGDFATDSDWTKGANTTISSGTLNFSSASSNTDQSLTTTNSKIYKVIFSISNYVSGSVRFRFTGTANVNGTNRSTNGTFTQYITATANNSIFRFAASSFSGSIDSVSVKESTRDNVPRIDYSGGGCPHILAEPQRTNLEADSSDFSQWSKFNTLVVTDDVISLDGTQNADFIKADANNTAHTIFNNYTVSNATSYTFTVYVKKNNLSYFQITSGQGFGNYFSNFNLDNGTVEVSTHIRSSIDLVSNGWYRCTVELLSSTTTGQVYPSIIKNATDSRNASNGDLLDKGYYVWGAQLEEGSYATSYIPTSGSTVTRNQDIFTRDGIGSLINSEEGVLFLEVAAFVKINPSGNITLTDGSGDNRIYIYYLVDNSISVIYNINSTGAVIHNFALTDITQQTKIAVKWGNSNVSVYINGSSVLSTATSNFSPNTLNQLSFSKPSGTVPFEGKVRQLQVYKTALTDAQLTSLTS